MEASQRNLCVAWWWVIANTGRYSYRCICLCVSRIYWASYTHERAPICGSVGWDLRSARTRKQDFATLSYWMEQSCSLSSLDQDASIDALEVAEIVFWPSFNILKGMERHILVSTQMKGIKLARSRRNRARLENKSRWEVPWCILRWPMSPIY